MGLILLIILIVLLLAVQRYDCWKSLRFFDLRQAAILADLPQTI